MNSVSKLAANEPKIENTIYISKIENEERCGNFSFLRHRASYSNFAEERGYRVRERTVRTSILNRQKCFLSFIVFVKKCSSIIQLFKFQ